MKHFYCTIVSALLLLATTPLLAQVNNHFVVYGQLQQDYGRGYDLLQLPDGNFVVGGVWNKKAFLMKVNPAGEQLVFRVLDQEFSGNSQINSLTTNGLGDLIAVGDCDHCTGADTLNKTIALRADATTLQTLVSKKYAGTDLSLNRTFNGHVVRTANGQLVLLASVSNNNLNFEDLLLRGLNPNSLEVQWERQLNSCGNCGFEYVLAATSTTAGFSAVLQHAFTDSISLYHFDQTGQTIWKRRFPSEGGTTSAGMAFGNNRIYLASQAIGQPSDPTNTACVLVGFNEATGEIESGLLLNDTLINESLHDLRVTDNGTLLAAYRRAEPNAFGTYAVSRVYRIDQNPMQVIDYVQLPNPNDITSILVNAAVPANADGSALAATGSYGFNYRPFFFSTVAVSGTTDTKSGTEVGIWPNPNNGAFTLTLGAWASANTTVEIFDLNGRLLQRWQGVSTPVDHFNLQTPTPGVYYLRVVNGSQTYTQKLLVH